MEYQDFKYIMSDMTKIYLGAKQTYAEACENDYMRSSGNIFTKIFLRTRRSKIISGCWKEIP